MLLACIADLWRMIKIPAVAIHAQACHVASDSVPVLLVLRSTCKNQLTVSTGNGCLWIAAKRNRLYFRASLCHKSSSNSIFRIDGFRRLYDGLSHWSKVQ